MRLNDHRMNRFIQVAYIPLTPFVNLPFHRFLPVLAWFFFAQCQLTVGNPSPGPNRQSWLASTRKPGLKVTIKWLGMCTLFHRWSSSKISLWVDKKKYISFIILVPIAYSYIFDDRSYPSTYFLYINFNTLTILVSIN